MAPGKFEWNFRYVIFKWILGIDGWGLFSEIAPIWMSLDFIDDQSTLVHVMAWWRQATSHYVSQCWPRSLSPYGVTRPQWVNYWPSMTCDKLSTLLILKLEQQLYWLFNSLWPSDAIWEHRTGSTMAQVMACCLTAPSHYLNQCWLIISEVQWHSSEGNFTGDTLAINHQD